jgi:multiple sugar transport system substrate-binding protein
MKKKNQLKISRRTVMKGALAAGAVMSATSIPSQLFAGQYDIPDPLKPLPTTGGNMRWIDSGDMKGVFWKKIFPEYAASRGITIDMMAYRGKK